MYNNQNIKVSEQISKVSEQIR